MFTLVIGGAASGKSEYAEKLILECGEQSRTYIATMEPFDDECIQRIERHRAMRAEKGFDTVECYTNLLSVVLPKKGAVLLECMGNLAANEIYSSDVAGEETYETVILGVESLLRQCNDLVIVSNDVFGGGRDYAKETVDYMKLLARINRALAEKADKVCEVICGIPFYYKGADSI